MSFFRRVKLIVTALLILACAIHDSRACTGITLKAKDGTVVYGRTMEWGSFDLNSRLVVIRAATSSPATHRTKNRA